MKLKTKATTSIERETNIDLPVYFYFQDELCNDEFMMFDGRTLIKITHNNFGFIIDVSHGVISMPEHYLMNTTSKENFEESMSYAINYIKTKVSNPTG